MRVIRHESGWDVALDMVFTDKTTAETIARRIRSAVHALVRDAVDASMCARKVPNDARGEALAKTVRPAAGQYSGAQPQHPQPDL